MGEKKTQKMQKIKKGPTDVAETFRMSQLGSLELKFKSGQMANFRTDTKLQARGVWLKHFQKKFADFVAKISH